MLEKGTLSGSLMELLSSIYHCSFYTARRMYKCDKNSLPNSFSKYLSYPHRKLPFQLLVNSFFKGYLLFALFNSDVRTALPIHQTLPSINNLFAMVIEYTLFNVNYLNLFEL